MNNYIMTDWGPMLVCKRHDHYSGQSSNSSTKIDAITQGAPESMDTFLEVYNKYLELENRLNNLDPNVDKNLVQKVDTLPSATKDTVGYIYVTPQGSYITLVSGTSEAPTYSWESISTEDSFATLDDIDDLWKNWEAEDVEWVEEQVEIDLSTGQYDSDEPTIVWETDDLIIQQLTGLGITKVGNYTNPIRFYDSNILTFHTLDTGVYISEVKLIKATKDGGGTIKPGLKLGTLSGKQAVVSSVSLTATKDSEGWTVSVDEEVKTDSVCLQYDGQVIDGVDLYAVGQLLISKILVTLKRLS